MHDTVFRHNTPMKGFAKAVGTKTTFTIVKSKLRRAAAAPVKHKAKATSNQN